MSFSIFSRAAKLTIQSSTRTPPILRSTTFDKTFLRTFSHTKAIMGVHNIESKAVWEKLITEEKATHPVVVLDAFATWCGPCKVISPKVLDFSKTYTNVHFTKVDVDDVPDLAQDLGIRAMPTFLIFKNGEKYKEVVGANPIALEAAIKEAAAGLPEAASPKVEDAPKAE